MSGTFSVNLVRSAAIWKACPILCYFLSMVQLDERYWTVSDQWDEWHWTVSDRSLNHDNWSLLHIFTIEKNILLKVICTHYYFILLLFAFGISFPREFEIYYYYYYYFYYYRLYLLCFVAKFPRAEIIIIINSSSRNKKLFLLSTSSSSS